MSKTQNRALPLLAGAIIQLCIGIIYIWSIFKGPVTQYYSAVADPALAATCASVTYSLMLATFVLGIVLGGRLNDKKGPRPVVLGGGLMFVGGILLAAASAAFAPQYPQLICVFYGGVAGFGVGAAYTSTISCAQKWFLDKKGFATGIIVCTFGASTVIFTPLVNYLLSAIGVPYTFMTLALIFLVVIAIFARFIQNPSAEYMQKFTAAQPQLVTQKQYTPGEVVKTKQYYFLLICMVLLTAAYFIFNPLFKSLGQERGLDESAALLAVMLTGVASACGRLVAPWLSDKVGRKNALLLLFVLSIAAVLLLLSAQGYIYILLIAVIAFSFGGSAGVFPAINADFFGVKNAGVNYGLIMIGFAVSALTFPTIASAVNAGGTTTPLTFILPAAACVAGIVFTLLLKNPAEKKAD